MALLKSPKPSNTKIGASVCQGYDITFVDDVDNLDVIFYLPCGLSGPSNIGATPPQGYLATFWATSGYFQIAMTNGYTYNLILPSSQPSPPASYTFSINELNLAAEGKNPGYLPSGWTIDVIQN
ncbi:MAG TPA: hypothetical protein VJX67_05555 [Blastocatellia bacterium]|nr:hypothetical protein [Blastocatellia bacterium]